MVDHNINITKYKPLRGNNDIKLPKELDQIKKDLINIQSINDNASNDVWSDTYILPIIINQEFEKLAKN